MKVALAVCGACCHGVLACPFRSVPFFQKQLGNENGSMEGVCVGMWLDVAGFERRAHCRYDGAGHMEDQR
jgi:hypothetical protein